VLGSTGSYAWLSREQRMQVIRQAKSHAGAVPLMAGIGALGTDRVLRLAEDAQRAGAALLLPAIAYQPLTEEEILARPSVSPCPSAFTITPLPRM
jgi:4-hydroxy-tetrahydrodipicolinate synthase